jgi:hypothetical protein
VPDPADVADADAYEDLIHNNLATIDSEPDQTAIGEAPELTEQEDPSAIGDHSDLTSPQGMPTVIVDQFPSVAQACRYPTSLRALCMSHAAPRPWTHRGPHLTPNWTGK